MAVCDIKGHPDLYGLGIRLSFYAAWLSSIIIELIDERSSLAPIRFVTLLLSLAGTISLIIQVASDNLAGAEIYIMLLLSAGTYLFLVPYYIWRALTLCNPFWDILRWTRERQSPIYKYMNFIVLLMVSGVATWFFITFLGDRDDNCTQYGYFLGKVNLSSKVWRAFNAMLYLVMILVCLCILLMKISLLQVSMWRKERKRKKIGTAHRELLYTLRTISNAAVFGAVVAGVELTIQWNNLDGTVDGIGTSAQLIPLVVVVGIALRTVFLYYADSEADDDDDDEAMRRRSSRSSKSSHRHHHHKHSHTRSTQYRTSTTYVSREWPRSPGTVHTKETGSMA